MPVLHEDAASNVPHQSARSAHACPAASSSLRQQLLIRAQQQADQLASQSSLDGSLIRGDSLPAGPPLPDIDLPLQSSSGYATPIWVRTATSGASSCEPRSPASPSLQPLEAGGSSPCALTCLHYLAQPPSAPPPTPAMPGTPASLATPKASALRGSSSFAARSWSSGASASASQHSSATPSRAASGGPAALWCITCVTSMPAGSAVIL